MPNTYGNRIAVAVLVVVALIGSLITALALVRQSEAAASEIVLEQLGDPGEHPFAPLAAPQEPKSSVAKPEPGLNLESDACNPEDLIAQLQADSAKAIAWTGALNADSTLRWSGGTKVLVEQVPDFIRELTAIELPADQRVTNYQYKNGTPTSVQSVLQKGSAVLVDQAGVTRVRCKCGNPLTPPSASTAVAPIFKGDPWPEFKKVIIVVDRQDCDADEYFADGRCRQIPDCADGQYFMDGECRGIPRCEDDEYFDGYDCRPLNCDGDEYPDDGYCKKLRCDDGKYPDDGQCRPICDDDEDWDGNECRDRCPPGTSFDEGECRPVCDDDQVFKDGEGCVTKLVAVPECDAATEVLQNGGCVDKPQLPRVVQPPTCDSTQVLQNGECVPKPVTTVPDCDAVTEVLQNGECVPKPVTTVPDCDAVTEVLQNGGCVDKPQLPRVVQPPTCDSTQVLQNGECVDKPQQPPRQQTTTPPATPCTDLDGDDICDIRDPCVGVLTNGTCVAVTPNP